MGEEAQRFPKVCSRTISSALSNVCEWVVMEKLRLPYVSFLPTNLHDVQKRKKYETFAGELHIMQSSS